MEILELINTKYKTETAWNNSAMKIMEELEIWLWIKKKIIQLEERQGKKWKKEADL